MEITAKKLRRLKERLRKKGTELSKIIRRREVNSNPGHAVGQTDAVSHTAIQVQDALRRIEYNAYGSCIACGRQIDWHRLEEIPWTPYCKEDEGKYEPAVASLKTAAASGQG